LVGSGSANREFTMGSVHWISGLEGNDTGPVELGKVSSELGGGDFWLVFVEESTNIDSRYNRSG
jgi:hypothetical protein